MRKNQRYTRSITNRKGLKMKKEYEVHLTVVEVYKVEADTPEEALALAYRGEAGDAWERNDIDNQVLEA